MCSEIVIFVGVFGSASTLREQVDNEKAAFQQSIRKNSALIAEKEQLVQSLRSEVGIKHATAQTFIQRSQKQKYDTDAIAPEQSHLSFHFPRPVNRNVFSSQLAERHSEGASVRSLQGAVQALEQDKKHLEEHAQRLEKELAAAKNTISLPSGKL